MFDKSKMLKYAIFINFIFYCFRNFKRIKFKNEILRI